jgi:hypothetical protein
MADPAYISGGTLLDGEAWVGLGTTTLGSDTATVTFTSTDDGQVGDFSQYMDLVLICYGRTDRVSVSDAIQLAVNNDTTNGNYSMQRFYGYAGSASANSTTSHGYKFGEMSCPAASSPANVFSACIIHCFDVNSGKYKSNVLTSASEGWNTGSATSSGWVHLQANTWKSQAPITEFDFTSAHGTNIASGSMFSLFGVLPRMVA